MRGPLGLAHPLSARDVLPGLASLSPSSLCLSLLWLHPSNCLFITISATSLLPKDIVF